MLRIIKKNYNGNKNKKKFSLEGRSMMNIDKGLNEIATQILHIKKKDIEERLKSYSIICSIFYRIDALVKGQGYVIDDYESHKEELLCNLDVICMLDDDEYSEEEHLVRALAAINKLKLNRRLI